MPGPKGHWVRISTPSEQDSAAGQDEVKPLNNPTTMSRPPTEESQTPAPPGSQVSSNAAEMQPASADPKYDFKKYGFGFVIVLHAISNGDPTVSRNIVVIRFVRISILFIFPPNWPLSLIAFSETHANSGHFRRPFHCRHPIS
jgi:hypothetical protein